MMGVMRIGVAVVTWMTSVVYISMLSFKFNHVQSKPCGSYREFNNWGHVHVPQYSFCHDIIIRRWCIMIITIYDLLYHH